MKGSDGKEVDLSKATSSTKAETRVYEVIKDSDEMKGVLTVGDYIAPSAMELKYTHTSNKPVPLMNQKPGC